MSLEELFIKCTQRLTHLRVPARYNTCRVPLASRNKTYPWIAEVSRPEIEGNEGKVEVLFEE